MYEYRIANIGMQFTNKTRQTLETQLNDASNQGWELDTVFGVEEKTCIFQTVQTYYMVLRRPLGSGGSNLPA